MVEEEKVETVTAAAAVPDLALNALRDIQSDLDSLNHKKTGIMLGLFSALDLKKGTIINLRTGMFDLPKEDTKE